MTTEKLATQLLKRAVELDYQKRLEPSLACYEEGIVLLMKAHKNCEDASKKKNYRENLEKYLSRAEKIKESIKRMKETGKYLEQIKIENDACGFDYSNIFGWYLDETVDEVQVEDPYIRSPHQISNFLRVCELLVIKCSNIKTIKLLTSRDDRNHALQDKSLDSIKTSLASRNIKLIITYSTSLHDRQIQISNGWLVKIGRGLDIFKKTDDKFSIGFHEMSLRKCHETTVDIIHSKNIHLS